MTWRGGDVWADAEAVASNQVRQLLVADGEFVLTADGNEVHGPTGTHPAVRVGGVAPDVLHARVPMASRGGQSPRGTRWEGPRRRITPEDVLASYTDALTLRTESHTRPGLRRPQVGAVHAVLAYLTTGRTQPCTVVMPTGTGKTETMLALLLAARPSRLLVVVPSDALRGQVAGKFERLGVLHATGVALPTALRPVVGRMTHSLPDEAQTDAFLSMCNVVVATPAVLTACTPQVRARLMAGCTHLFVDEAHHVAARTWKEIRDAFEGCTVVQFTATPFRTDNKHVGGDIVYAFPLREAQKDGYFASINFRSVVDLIDEDKALADAAVATLRVDLDAGLDHLMMVRTSSVNRATQLLETYRARAPEMNPVLLHSGQKLAVKDAARQALDSRASKIVVCVNMLGEGFDLPSLKIAAIHDTQKSLGVTLQFIGRFTRVDAGVNLGNATVLVVRGYTARDPRLRAPAEGGEVHVGQAQAPQRVAQDLAGALAGEDEPGDEVGHHSVTRNQGTARRRATLPLHRHRRRRSPGCPAQGTCPGIAIGRVSRDAADRGLEQDTGPDGVIFLLQDLIDSMSRTAPYTAGALCTARTRLSRRWPRPRGSHSHPCRLVGIAPCRHLNRGTYASGLASTD